MTLVNLMILLHFKTFLQCLVSLAVTQEQCDLTTGEVTLIFQSDFFGLFDGAQNRGDQIGWRR